MAAWESKAPTFSPEQELAFTNRLKGWLEGAFYRTFKTSDTNFEASGVSEAYAQLSAAQLNIVDAIKSDKYSREGDDVDVMQTMKRKLRAQFETATKDTTPETRDVVQLARTYASLLNAQALRK